MGLFEKRPFAGTAYFRSTLVQDDRGLPNDQRWKESGRPDRIMSHLDPKEGYFAGRDEAQKHLILVNGALEQLEEERIEEERQRREEEMERERERREEEERKARSKLVQTEPPSLDESPCDDVDATTDFGIMKLSKMEAFIKEIATHSAQCGAGVHAGECPVKLVKRDTSQGAGIIYLWKCRVCGKEMEMRNCDWVRSVCEPGRAFARLQPEINLRLMRGAREVGINLYKLLHFVGGYVGIKYMTYRNLLHCEKKWRATVKELFGLRLEENREEHVKATRESPNYPGDLECEINGQQCSVCQATGAIDGAGPTRSFNNHHRGTQSAAVTISGETKKPIDIQFDQTKCIMCTRTLNAQLHAVDGHVPVEEFANYSTAHEGTCHKNSAHNPASAECFQAARAGQSLLLDENGDYLGDDKACFLTKVYADNDASSPANFIRAQNDIIGAPSDDKAEHYPDTGHVMKVNNNDFYHIRNKEPVFRGKQLLTNERIASIHSDLRGVIEDYHKELGDATARERCVNQIHAIIPHHCGDHSGCKIEKFCTYLQVKNEQHSDWTDTQIRAEAAKRSKRHGGRHMELNEYGKQRLQKMIFKRFSLENIDRIAECGCSNSCEQFWGRCVQFSEGKRLCLDHTDYWLSILHLVFCYSGGNEEKTRQQLGDMLNLVASSQEVKTAETLAKKRKKDYDRSSSEKGKASRTLAKMTKRHRMQKEDKTKGHRSGKVPLKRSAKSKVKKCPHCRMVGVGARHSANKCPMPVLKKRGRSTQIDWYADESKVIGDAQPRKRRRKMFKDIDWSK